MDLELVFWRRKSVEEENLFVEVLAKGKMHLGESNDICFKKGKECHEELRKKGGNVKKFTPDRLTF